MPLDSMKLCKELVTFKKFSLVLFLATYKLPYYERKINMVVDTPQTPFHNFKTVCMVNHPKGQNIVTTMKFKRPSYPACSLSC